ncbi:serine/threonine-rich protein adg2-like [Dendronephthya gigantea]|uniref:serine/threonine-rich protein adg2-like n=1 Tax=Dendronephthya gigantea TaxID=151771 RepID=UPI00106DA935|nr:serine/threonine-rich protein adg2-like [Dendronephthya gigantea]
MAPAIMLLVYLFSLSYGQKNHSSSNTLLILQSGTSAVSYSESKMSVRVGVIGSQTFTGHVSPSNMLPVSSSYAGQLTTVKPGQTSVLNTEINQRNSTQTALPTLPSKVLVTSTFLKYSALSSHISIEPSFGQTLTHSDTSGQIPPTISTHRIKATKPQKHSSNLFVRATSTTMYASKQSMTVSFQLFSNLTISSDSYLARSSPSSNVVTNPNISISSRAFITSMGPDRPVSSLSITKLNPTLSKALSQTFVKNTALSSLSHVQKSMQPSTHLMMNSSSTMLYTPVKPSTTRGNIISRNISYHYKENASTAVCHNTSKVNSVLGSTSVAVNSASSKLAQTSSSMTMFTLQPSSPQRKANKTVITSFPPTSKTSKTKSEVKFSLSQSSNPMAMNATVSKSNIQKSIPMPFFTINSSSTMVTPYKKNESVVIPHHTSAPSSEKSHTPLIVGLAVGLSLGVVLVIVIIVCYRRKRSSYQYNVFYDEQNIVMHPFDYSK